MTSFQQQPALKPVESKKSPLVPPASKKHSEKPELPTEKELRHLRNLISSLARASDNFSDPYQPLVKDCLEQFTAYGDSLRLDEKCFSADGSNLSRSSMDSQTNLMALAYLNSKAALALLRAIEISPAESNRQNQNMQAFRNIFGLIRGFCWMALKL
ncbi:MAG: hypothetical protein R3A13_05400 [Bdellovibrionota bacterium]